MAKNPHLRPSHIAESLKDKFNGSSADRRQIATFLNACREKDPAVFCFLNNPDDYRSRYELAWGDNTEKALHFLHYVEVDSSPADVICADGKRHTIIGLIDVFSRKAKFIVTKTSNSWAIAGVIRSTIVDWGVPENLVRDNGRDYDSKLVNEGLQALQINVVNVPPFTPNAKPCIERMFRSLAHMLFEKLPGYCGHNVAERKAIEARRSFAYRFMKRGENVEMGLTPEELQAIINAWVENKCHQRIHGTLRVSPNAKAASVPVRPRRIEDPRSLDILLAPAPGSTVRNVGEKGIHLDNQIYVGDCLIDWTGRDVLVRLDIRDAGRIFCFDPEKKTFIGEAFDPAISGITVGDKMAAKKRTRKRVMEKVKALKTLAQEAGDPYAEEIRAIKESRAQLTNLRVGDLITDNPFVTAANAAASSVRESEKSATERFFEEEAFALSHVPEPISEDPKVVRFPGKDHSQPHPEIRYFANPLERFRWLIAEQRNRPLLPEEQDWVARNRDAWESFVRAFAKDWPEIDRRWLRPIAPDLFEVLEFQGGI